MKYKTFFKIAFLGLFCAALSTSCVKEGPMGPEGPAGKDGINGTNGKDVNETCKMCHAPGKMEQITVQYAQLSKHSFGEAAFEEAGNTTCSPCHVSEAFKYVIANNIPSTFVLNATTNRYDNRYISTAATSYGDINCGTCHASIHKTYTSADLPALTTVAPVPMTMWGGTKTITLPADGGSSHLCVRCHQPRPQTNLQNGNFQDYTAVAANPKTVAYDANNNSATTNIVRPSYRMHIHYGSAGAIFAGVGGVEFAGTLPYTKSVHATIASCADCHMATTNGRAGGHSFKVRNSGEHTGLTSSTSWNFNGCNQTGCHSTAITSTTSAFWTTPRADIKTLLETLASKLTVNGLDILDRDNDLEANLWAGITSKNYSGYLNVYDPTLNNPASGKTGYANTAGQFQNASAPSAPNATWSQAMIDYNKTLPKLSLTNAQYGAILNFQLVLRDYSLGIHNYPYTKALLTNSIAVL